MTSDELNWRFLHTPKTFLYISLGIHLCLPLFFGGLKLMDDLGWSLLGPRKPQKEMYQEFIQVDMIGLPDQTIGQLQNDIDTSLPISDTPKEPAKTEETDGKDAKNVDGKTEEDVMAELQAKQAAEAAAKAEVERKEKERQAKEKAERERVLRDMEREAALKELADKGSRGKLKGNILSKGTSSKGAIGTAKDRYISQIAKKVKENFFIQPHQKKRGLVGVVFLRVNAKGKLKERPTIVQASKDRLFDSALVQAIVDSAPFDVPDDDSVIKEGITIEFRADE